MISNETTVRMASSKTLSRLRSPSNLLESLKIFCGFASFVENDLVDV